MNKVKVLEKPVAVLGGGACAQAFAAEFTLAGYKVRLYELPELAQGTLGEVLRTHEIELGGAQANFKWFRRAGVAKVDVVTTEISEALRGAGCNVDVIIGGWSSMPYGVRVVEPGKLDCIIRIRELLGDALPGKDGDRFFETLKGIPAFDGTVELKKGDTIIGVGLSNPNPAVHVPGSILNVGAMEVSEMEGTLGIPKGKYSMYKHGMSPAVARVQLAFYQEERKIASAMGIEMIEFRDDQFFWKGGIMGVEYWVPFADVIIPPIVGPNSVEHRYFTEDIPVGTVIRYHLAKKFGVDVPTIESMIRLGSAICKRDFLKEGITLRELGIEDLTKEQIIRYVREGIKG